MDPHHRGGPCAVANWVLGKWWIGNIELTGPLEGTTAAFETLIRDRYASVLLGIFATSFAGAVKTYRKDRERLFVL